MHSEQHSIVEEIISMDTISENMPPRERRRFNRFRDALARVIIGRFTVNDGPTTLRDEAVDRVYYNRTKQGRRLFGILRRAATEMELPESWTRSQLHVPQKTKRRYF